MLSVQLTNLATILDHAGVAPNVSSQAKHWSKTIEQAVWEHTVRRVWQKVCILLICLSQVVDGIFAYETNGMFLTAIFASLMKDSLRIGFALCDGRCKRSGRRQIHCLEASYNLE